MPYTHLHLASATAYNARIPRLDLLDRSSSLFLRDGSLVLASETMLYRVHRDMMDQRCTFFESLPTLQENSLSEDSGQMFCEGQPVIPMLDDLAYLDVFLNMLLSTVSRTFNYNTY